MGPWRLLTGLYWLAAEPGLHDGVAARGVDVGEIDAAVCVEARAASRQRDRYIDHADRRVQRA